MILPEVSVGSYITQLSLYAQESHISCHNMWISHYRVYSHYISAAEYKMQTEGLSAVVFFFFFFFLVSPIYWFYYYETSFHNACMVDGS